MRSDTLTKIVDDIKKLKEFNSLSKHEQLVLGILDSMNSGHLNVGDQLPSINVMVEEVGFARKTIVKAYEELKEKGLVESKKTKGYYVVSIDTQRYLKIALIMYSFQRFQQEFYNTLRKKLQDKVQIDVFFHHNNEDVFETIFGNILGKYGMYVVAPIQSGSSRDILASLQPEKLIIVDRFLDLGKDYSYVVQEFNRSTMNNLNLLLPKIKKYKKTILFFREDRDYPGGIKQAYIEFCKLHDIEIEIVANYENEDVSKDVLYICIDDLDLWLLLKDCRNNDFRIGKDIGVLSFNDHVVKEIISGGITTISTDFKEMATITADNIRSLGYGHSIVPTHLIERGSL
ncbi:MAG: GntR family transcriptional regulator [Bacteroidota bacterium]